MIIEGIKISGLTSDSRLVKPGFLFAALDSEKAKGVEYIPMAVEKGASVIVAKPEYIDEKKYENVKFIASENPNLEFAKIAAEFYGGQPENVAGITGTNGKTSIADFIRQILTSMGEKAASIGTLGLIKGSDAPIPSSNTTPNAVEVQKELAELKNEGFSYAIMEMSSHGLCQYRVGGVKVKVAGFTNFTQDHLDYHKTFENYLNAKLILFTDVLVKGGLAVLNADIEVFPIIKKACLDTGKKVITYGRNGKDLRLIEAVSKTTGKNLRSIILARKRPYLFRWPESFRQ